MIFCVLLMLESYISVTFSIYIENGFSYQNIENTVILRHTSLLELLYSGVAYKYI